jgi:hypothetical protein
MTADRKSQRYRRQARRVLSMLRDDRGALHREFSPTGGRWWLCRPGHNRKQISTRVAEIVLGSGEVVLRDPGLIADVGQSYEAAS